MTASTTCGACLRTAASRRKRSDLVLPRLAGSLTDGLGADLDAVVTMERVSGTDAKVIVCGHTHLPEVAKWLANDRQRRQRRQRLRRRSDGLLGVDRHR